jgi:bidirectional [NiFe] hydrogenase diaphorase subunit
MPVMTDKPVKGLNTMDPSSSLENEPIEIIIDGKPYRADPGMTVLEALKSHDFDIPTLCFHPALKPSGSCRLCAVEVVAKSGKAITMLSCILPVKNGLEIKTQGELVKQARVRAFGNLIQMAPQSRKFVIWRKSTGSTWGPRRTVAYDAAFAFVSAGKLSVREL